MALIESMINDIFGKGDDDLTPNDFSDITESEIKEMSRGEIKTLLSNKALTESGKVADKLVPLLNNRLMDYAKTLNRSKSSARDLVNDILELQATFGRLREFDPRHNKFLETRR